MLYCSVLFQGKNPFDYFASVSCAVPLEIVVKKETRGKADMIPDKVMSFVQAGFRSRQAN